METFRTFEHHGRILQLSAYEEPAPTARKSAGGSVNAPGAGRFEISQVSLSTNIVAPGETLTLFAQIDGSQIAYVFTEILLADPEANRFYGPVAREFVRAEINKETRDVSRPMWGQSIRLQIAIQPTLGLITSGTDSAFAFCLPESYGSSNRLLDGLYTSADGTGQRRSRISLDSAGNIHKIVAYKEMAHKSPPRELTLQPNDQFSPFAQLLAPPAGENTSWQVGKCLSTTLTFQNMPFVHTAAPLLPGKYLAGIVVQDLDGKYFRRYAPFIATGS